jgi:hypothetical protein
MALPIPSQLRQEPRVQLPPLPAEVRYYDDFSDTYLSLATPEEKNGWTLVCDGRVRNS